MTEQQTHKYVGTYADLIQHLDFDLESPCEAAYHIPGADPYVGDIEKAAYFISLVFPCGKKLVLLIGQKCYDAMIRDPRQAVLCDCKAGIHYQHQSKFVTTLVRL